MDCEFPAMTRSLAHAPGVRTSLQVCDPRSGFHLLGVFEYNLERIRGAAHSDAGPVSDGERLLRTIDWDNPLGMPELP